MKRYIFFVLMLPVLFLAGACNRTLDFNGESDPVLLISPVVQDGQDLVLATRALGEDDLKDTEYNENVVNRLDVFFFEGNALKKDYHLGQDALVEVTRSGKTGYMLSNDWIQDGLQKDVAYTVYVVANSTVEAVTAGTGITAPADLESLVRTEGDIYKRQKNNATSGDNTFTSSKSFLMTAIVPSWSISSFTTQLVNNQKVTLTRAAVKFVIDLSLSDEFKARLATDHMQYGTPDWKYLHFNTKTYEVPNSQAEAQKLLVDSASGAAAYLSVESPDENGHYTIVTYAYPHTWTAGTADDETPAILLSFLAGPLEGYEGKQSFHYYYIPLCEVGKTNTERNNLYKVNAIISSYGSSEAISSNDVQLTYEVMPWATAKEADINAVPTDYIMVTPTNYSFKGGVSGTPMTTQIKFYASGAVTLSNPVGEYKDRTGNWQTVTLGDGVFTATKNQASGATTGTVDLSSWVPTNGTSRRVRFTLTCGTKSQTVTVVHFPLDFISAEDGAYSTYDYNNWVTPNNSSRYASSGIRENKFTFYRNNDGALFDAHTFSGGYVYDVQQNGNLGSRVNEGQGADDLLTNNQMYILQITSASDQYTIGRPSLSPQSGNVYDRQGDSPLGSITYYTSKDDVISPAFMLGSQLGAVGTVSSNAFAAMHCALYKEHIDGKDFTGWRLPTKQEIQYMMDNQASHPEVMIEVLSGEYYWALDGTYGHNPNGSGGSASGSKYVRCVRDVSAEEIETINAKLFD